jgi:hypothetical protein
VRQGTAILIRDQVVGGRRETATVELVDLSDDPEVVFVRLVPLAGG